MSMKLSEEEREVLARNRDRIEQAYLTRSCRGIPDRDKKVMAQIYQREVDRRFRLCCSCSASVMKMVTGMYRFLEEL